MPAQLRAHRTRLHTRGCSAIGAWPGSGGTRPEIKLYFCCTPTVASVVTSHLEPAGRPSSQGTPCPRASPCPRGPRAPPQPFSSPVTHLGLTASTAAALAGLQPCKPPARPAPLPKQRFSSTRRDGECWCHLQKPRGNSSCPISEQTVACGGRNGALVSLPPVPPSPGVPVPQSTRRAPRYQRTAPALAKSSAATSRAHSSACLLLGFRFQRFSPSQEDWKAFWVCKPCCSPQDEAGQSSQPGVPRTRQLCCPLPGDGGAGLAPTPLPGSC